MLAFWMVTLSQFIACKGCQDTKISDIDTGVIEEFGNNWGKWLDMGVTPEGQPVIAYYAVLWCVGLATEPLKVKYFVT